MNRQRTFADMPDPDDGDDRDHDDGQDAELKRVRGRIGPLVVEFLNGRGVGSEFHAEDLYEYVCPRAKCAPASADRILRDLNFRGVIRYEVVNRGQSHYRVKEAADLMQ